MCVFCGKHPEKKSKEHVVPQWLIEATGDPNRAVYLGIVKDFENGFRPRTYAFDQFSFPACEECNNRHSSLEDAAKSVLNAITAQQKVGPAEMSVLLDWFDKVRVGLWLGLNQLDKNYVDIEPQFAIASRMGQYDRMLCIEKSDGETKKLNFGGVDTVAFAFSPTAFVLIVNNYYFTNISHMFLISRRIGFPYPRSAYILPDSDRLEIDLHPGRERMSLPLIRRRMKERGTVIYQPMFPGGLVDGDMSIYDKPYVRKHSLDHAQGRGSLFLEVRNGLQELRPGQSISIEPHHVHDDWELFVSTAVHVCEWQNWLNSQLPSMDKLSKAQQAYIKKRYGLARKLNNMLIRHHTSLLRPEARGKVKG
ncbi:hypothetical protein CAI21_08925 [Alkalilimnicola ehrlichii]|nr:hypothetical protein CAI21_08925 [Alkalilimnicola ehrlichii]